MESESFDLDLIQANEIQLMDKSAASLHETEKCINNPEDKSQVFKGETRCMIKARILQTLQKIYAELLVTITVISVFVEILHGPIPLFHIHVYFYFYLLGVSILIFVGSFVRTLIHKLNGEGKSEECEAGIWQKNNNYLNLTRCFMFGLVVCGLAGLICTCFGLVAILASGKCLSATSSALPFLHFIFILLQLIFLFMNANRLIDVFGCFHKISIMHLVATNAALWLYVLLFESSKDWQEAVHVMHNSSIKWGHKDINISLHSLESDIRSADQNHHIPKHVVHVTSNCWWRDVSEIEHGNDILSIQLCLQNSSVGIMWKKASDILYPVVVQYYLIVLFLFYITWKSLTLRCKKQCSSLAPVKTQNYSYCLCLSAEFYLSCVILIASIIIVVSCIILEITYFDVVVLSLFIINFTSSISAVLYGLSHMKSVTTNIKSLNQNSVNFYLEIGMYFIYAYGLCNLFAGCVSVFEGKYNLLIIIESLLMIFHAILQHIFIQSRMVQKSRQVMIFLVVSNLSLWILESFTFRYKSPADIQQKIYGAVAWPVINRVIIPCLAFYRFHCAIVLSDELKHFSSESH